MSLWISNMVRMKTKYGNCTAGMMVCTMYCTLVLLAKGGGHGTQCTCMEWGGEWNEPT